MKFHLVHNQRSLDPALLHMDQDTIMLIVRNAPPSILSKDLSEWYQSAKHGDTFKVNSSLHVLALDLTEFGFSKYA
jgi:hypothetical protein